MEMVMMVERRQYGGSVVVTEDSLDDQLSPGSFTVGVCVGLGRVGEVGFLGGGEGVWGGWVIRGNGRGFGVVG